MGLAVDDEDSPSPPPSSPPPIWHHPHHPLNHGSGAGHLVPMNLAGPQCPGGNGGGGIPPATLFGLTAAAAAVANLGHKPTGGHHHHHHSHHPDSLTSHLHHSVNQTLLLSRKRQFDVASLLAPEREKDRQLSPSSCKSDEIDRDQSLSSPSPPPPTMSKRLNSGDDVAEKEDQHRHHDSSGGEHSDNEDIEVTEEKEELESISSQSNRRKDLNDSSSTNSNTPLPKQRRSSTLGQGGNSSNEEDDNVSLSLVSGIGTQNQSRHPSSSGGQFGGNPMNFGGFHAHGQLNHESFSQSNLSPHGVGVMSPLDFIQAQHFLQQQQHQQTREGGGGGVQNSIQNSNFPFGSPGVGQNNFLQQNSSLASLMILSSRYKELTSNMIMASRSRSPQLD